MRLVNRTTYATRELRGLACLAYRSLAKVEGPASWWPHLRITVQYGRRRTAVTGWAYLRGGPVTICVPRAGRPEQSWTVHPDGTRVTKPPSRLGVLRVLMHELMHCYGYTHKQFTAPRAPAFPNFEAGLTVVTPRVAPPVDRRALRHERLLAGLARWESKQRRAVTAIRKLKRRLRSYDHRAAASTSSSVRHGPS